MEKQIVVYGNPTPSDLRFMHSDPFSFPSKSSSSTLSSTRSDAESAPPELDRLFHEICEESVELVSNTQLPSEWSIPDLIHAVMGNEVLQMPGYLQDTYHYIILRGSTSLLFEELFHFINLINYAP